MHKYEFRNQRKFCYNSLLMSIYYKKAKKAVENMFKHNFTTFHKKIKLL